MTVMRRKGLAARRSGRRRLPGGVTMATPRKPPARERHPSQARRVTTTDLSWEEKSAVEEAARRDEVSISRWMADAARERLRADVEK